MPHDLQDIVDRLAADLGAAVVVEDARQQLVAFSAQDGPVDRMRQDSILRRVTSPDVVAWFAQFRITDAVGPVRTPPAPELGILGRCCVPLRYGRDLVGYLWVIDDDGALATSQAERLTADHDHLATLLYERHLSLRLQVQEVAHLLSDVPELQAGAATSLTDRGQWPAGAGVRAVVATVGGDPATVLAETLDELARGASDTLRAAFADHLVLLVPDRGDGARRADALAEQVQEALRARAGSGSHVAVGVGDPRPRLRAAHETYHEARLTSQVAAATGPERPVQHWGELGVYRTLARLVARGADELELDPRVATLLADADADTLRTAEVYLDLAGDAQRAAAELYLHRGTLYYRLEKVTRVSGLNLRDGNDRLALHLGFKIARLRGDYPPA